MGNHLSLIVATAGIGASVSVLAFTMMRYWFSQERKVEKRMDALVEFADSELAEAEPLNLPFAQRIVQPAIEQLAAGARSLTPHDYLQRVRSRLISAGKLDSVTAESIILARVGMVIVGLIAGIVGGTLFGLANVQPVLAGIVLAVILSLLPERRIDSWAKERRTQIVRELPDMLDMLMISVQAGLGFDQAVARYINYSSGPLAQEFAKALQEIQAGKTRREAFRALGDRAGEPALRSFVMAIVQADVFGVSVADVLRAQSYELRTKRRQLAEEEAKKAPVKMTIPLMGCVLPTTVLVVMTPAVVALVQVFSSM